MRLPLVLATVGGLWCAVALQAGEAQDVGSLWLRAEPFAAGSTGERLPFWLSANRYGTVDPASANAGLRLGAHRLFTDDSGLEYSVGARAPRRRRRNRSPNRR